MILPTTSPGGLASGARSAAALVPAASPPRAGAAAEAALLVHLAAKGVKTPAPLEGADGARVRMVAGRPAALFPWIPGEMVCQRGVTEAARTLEPSDLHAALA